jgi:hypothetical protein
MLHHTCAPWCGEWIFPGSRCLCQDRALGGLRFRRDAKFTMRTVSGSRYGSAGYNGPAMAPSYRAQLLVALGVFVLAFTTFHFYLDAAGLCGLGGCPELSQSSHVAHHGGGSSTACAAAVLVASLTVSAPAPFSGRHRAAKHRCPAEAYHTPDTPPPRFF